MGSPPSAKPSWASLYASASQRFIVEVASISISVKLGNFVKFAALCNAQMQKQSLFVCLLKPELLLFSSHLSTLLDDWVVLSSSDSSGCTKVWWQSLRVHFSSLKRARPGWAHGEMYSWCCLGNIKLVLILFTCHTHISAKSPWLWFFFRLLSK